nr:protein obstructor-E-like [Onthophagus taurus]XP_022913290.1 protein obstructor-E-like [Onthophagus taurus]
MNSYKNKAILLIAISFIIVIINGTPVNDCGKDVTSKFYPNFDDCTTYYNCSAGVMQLTNCPDGLLFHADYGYCDLAENVKC